MQDYDASRETDLYFKNPQTGEYKLAKRKEDSIALSLLKLNSERMETKQDVEQLKAMMNAQFGMFETLQRTQYEALLDKVESSIQENTKAIESLKNEMQIWANSVIDKQKGINKALVDKISFISHEYNNLKEEVILIKNTPDSKKAKLFDHLLFSFIGAGGGALLTMLIRFITGG